MDELIDAKLQQLIELVYRGPLEEQPWQSLVQVLPRLLAVDSAHVLLVSSLDDGENQLYYCGSDGQQVPQPWLSIDVFAAAPRGGALLLSDLANEAEWHASAWLRDMLHPAGVHQLLGMDVAINAAPQLTLKLRLSRGVSGAGFSTADKQLIEALAPHWQQAVQYFITLSIGRIERNAFADAVNQLLFGMVIVDGQGKVTTTNRVARDTLAGSAPVTVNNGQLQLLDQRQNREFYRLLAAIGRGEQSIPQVLALPAKSGQTLTLMVRPIRPDDRSHYPVQSLAVVFFSDQAATPAISADTLQAMFGFTDAEAKMAVLLANGFTMEEAAERLFISKNTAKTHAKAVYEKTGVSRQIKLIQLLSKSVARVAPAS